METNTQLERLNKLVQKTLVNTKHYQNVLEILENIPKKHRDIYYYKKRQETINSLVYEIEKLTWNLNAELWIENLDK